MEQHYCGDKSKELTEIEQNIGAASYGKAFNFMTRDSLQKVNIRQGKKYVWLYKLKNDFQRKLHGKVCGSKKVDTSR